LVSKLTELEAYKMFKDDPFFIADPDTARILRESEVPEEEFNYVFERLLAFQNASTLWWRWVTEGAKEKQIAMELAARDEAVQKIVSSWRGQLAKPRGYVVFVERFIAPDSMANSNFNVYIGTQKGIYPSKVAADSRKDAGQYFTVNWEPEDPISVAVEARWTYFAYDSNVVSKNLEGSLSLHRLSVETFFDPKKDYQLQFNVPDLPGPSYESSRLPRVSSSTVPTRQRDATSTGSASNTGSQPAEKEQKLDPVELLRNHSRAKE
jgi:hypothetical protein